MKGSPPLAWGIPVCVFDISQTERITPTCVGNTSRKEKIKKLLKDHPHLRGEYSPGLLLKNGVKGSPPLAWGIQLWDTVNGGTARITPTCVGNTDGLGVLIHNDKDHPHLRGEYGLYAYLRKNR